MGNGFFVFFGSLHFAFRASRVLAARLRNGAVVRMDRSQSCLLHCPGRVKVPSTDGNFLFFYALDCPARARGSWKHCPIENLTDIVPE